MPSRSGRVCRVSPNFQNGPEGTPEDEDLYVILRELTLAPTKDVYLWTFPFVPPEGGVVVVLRFYTGKKILKFFFKWGREIPHTALLYYCTLLNTF